MADVHQQSKEQQLEANKSRRDAREKDIKSAEAQVKENTAKQAKTNQETMDRQNNSKPTPTQEENDLAKMGVAQDSLEYDGAPYQGTTPEETEKLNKNAQGGKGAQYQTRAASPKS